MGGKPRILIELRVRAALKNFRQQQQLRDLDMQVVQIMHQLVGGVDDTQVGQVILIMLVLPLGCNGGK